MERDQEVKCPSCNRFVGVHTTCPYCGAAIYKRISIRIFKYSALAIAFIGLILLYFAARVVETKVIKVKDIVPSMSFAYVRVQGTVYYAPRIYEGSESLSFTVDDGTDRIRVTAYGAVMKELIQLGKIPNVGDRIDVAGQLQVREESASMILQRPEELKITPAATWAAQVPTFKIGDITTDEISKLIKCKGKIIDTRTFKKGRAFKISDGTGSIDVLVWDTDYAQIPDKDALQFDTEISVCGLIGEFRGQLQIKPRSPDEVRIADPEEALAIPETTTAVSTLDIGQISEATIDQLIICQGTVTQYKPFTKGVLLVVSDETGSIVVVLWDRVKDQIVDNRIFTVGTPVSVRGLVGVFQNQLQLVPRTADDIGVIQEKGGA
jgi:DNA/RNA endonuclease YhcR with UshA esterase domain